MGQTQSSHKCSYLDLLTFVQNTHDANFGPINIYRTQEAPYEYVMDYQKNYIEDDTRLNNYRSLMGMLQNIQHKNIAKVHGCELVEETQLCIKHKKLHTFCHYYNFTLQGAVEKKKIMDSSFPQSELIYIMSCLLEAACLLMEHGICHGDYRTQSIYLSPEGYVKLYLLEIDRQNKHTSYYRALGDFSCIDQYVLSPEQLHSIHQMDHEPKLDQYKADVFAIGMVILQLITLDKTKFYYNDARTELKIQRISFDLCSVGRHFSEQFLNLLKYCLHPNPARRCSLSQALNQLNSIRKTAKALSYCVRLQEGQGVSKPIKREITMSVKGQHILNGLQKRLTPSPITTLASSVQPMVKVQARIGRNE